VRAFIDDLYTVRIEFEGYISSVKILDESLQWLTTEGLFQWFKTRHPIQLQQAETIEINGVSHLLQIGLVTLTDDFNEKYTYDGPLGAVYTKSYTDFYVYSPVAKEIRLNLDGTTHHMKGDGTMYHVRVFGDFAYKAYDYEVRLHDTFKQAMDPYVSATTHTEGFINPKDNTSQIHHLDIVKPLDTVIYELHVRDVTIHLDVLDKGTFKGMLQFSQTLNGTVLDYIQSLGVTHIQLLPVFDYEGVNPLNKEALYNWGYNPKHYFSIQSWFSTEPDNPKQTLLEFKNLIDAIHQKGMHVIMDVVFNHVFEANTYPYDHFVPGYFYRHDNDYQMTNGSYCGNEVESRRFMVRRLIVDALSHFFETYGIDGFRFDLMGLTDVETMQIITKKLKEINPNILLYGEGWHMGEVLSDDERASQRNHSKMPGIAHFNDTFRNRIKGELHGTGLGYGTGGRVDPNELIRLLEGSPHVFEDPSFSINYVECHDNSTLFDKLLKDLPKKTYIKSYAHLCNAIVALSKGLTFYHAGQEMFRTKQGVENSYRSNDDINGINYNLGTHTEHFKELIAFKKHTKDFKRTYEVIDSLLCMTLSHEKISYVVVFKCDESMYTCLKEWGILSLSSAQVIDFNIIEPGVYVFKQ
jgi:pullulanase